MNEQAFMAFCRANDRLMIERDKDGNIFILSLSCFNVARLESEANFQLRLWNKTAQAGYVLSSTGGFTLPNGAVRSPDAAWVSRERMDALPATEKEQFTHICADFVIEIKSNTDRLRHKQEK